MTWNAGPRLAFNFGFTDLGAGRYLEAWIPANLIFDQFELTLTLQVLNTPIAHTLITNGAVTALGANNWLVTFPARFTALSPLLELRASDTLTSMTDTVTLPVSGMVITIEAWKLMSSPINLTTQINNLKTWLADNENSTGPYLHGTRFVTFLNVGGMEYDGGTTSGSGALRHETFHSWWARGLKPASQSDAWWDEAWTVYNDNGATASFPFDFSAPPVVLCTRNPWVRVTAGGAYGDGNRFFEGVAALIGNANLKSQMSDFYTQRKHRPATTTDLEEFLLCRTGYPQLVDVFHRFVYGFSDPSPAPNLWLRDDPAHGGNDIWTGRFWDSPDLWIRNADDGGTAHQPPEFGQDNWFYARVHNSSTSATARHFLVAFNVKNYAGIEFIYPGDFLPCLAAASGFELGPGASTIVKARWPAALVPPAGTHACWLAAVFTRFDHPVTGRHVWEHNNLAQKNLTVVNLVAGDWIVLPFVVANYETRFSRRFVLELSKPKGRTKLEAALLHSSGTAFKPTSRSRVEQVQSFQDTPINNKDNHVDCGSGALLESAYSGAIWTSYSPNVFAARQFENAIEARFATGHTAHIPIFLRRQEQLTLGLRLHIPRHAKPGEIIRVDLLKRDADGKRVFGGIAVEIHVVAQYPTQA